jgi:hypothetical protein
MLGLGAYNSDEDSSDNDKPVVKRPRTTINTAPDVASDLVRLHTLRHLTATQCKSFACHTEQTNTKLTTETISSRT